MKRYVNYTGLLVLVLAAYAWATEEQRSEPVDEQPAAGENTAKATFGSGCFWCTEAVFEQIPGVSSVVSGYTGGHVQDPSYRAVCGGDTGHAEAVEITFDPSIVSYEELLQLFWKSHDPTTPNRQGGDVGTQYRSAVFYHNDAQKAAAEQSKRETDASGDLAKPIVTEIAAAGTFYPAEDYHQDYFKNNPNAPYCVFNIKPKLKKLSLR